MFSDLNIYFDGDRITTSMPSKLSSYLKENKFTTINDESIQFVGFIELDNLYFILPKRFTYTGKSQQLSLILKVLNKYSGKIKKMSLPNCIVGAGDVGKKINLAYFILLDWLHNGIIKDEMKIRKLNGQGKINWKRTMDRFLPIDSQGAPVYLDYETSITKSQINSRIVEIQKIIVSDCDIKYHWLASEGYVAKQLHHHKLKDSEISAHILFLRKYARNVFCERTLNLIRMMIDYLSFTNITNRKSEFAFGTASFHSIWEDVCMEVLEGDNELKKLFPQPQYRFEEDVNRQKPKSFIGQIPDILVLKDRVLHVIDAKYYDIKRKSPPGWSDLVKQFFYGWSSTLNNDLTLKNMFAFPGEDYLRVGEVYLSDEHRELSEFGVIECIEVPTIEFMSAYIKKTDKQHFENLIYESQG